MTPSTRQRHRTPGLPSGFTLLELLIAITLLALLLTAAYSGLRTGTRAWTTGEKRAEQSEHMRIVSNFLRRQVSQAYPLVWTRQAKRTVWFRGGRTSMDFTAVLASRALDNGLAFLHLEFSEGKKGLQLVLSCKLAHGEDLQKDFMVKGHDECRRVRVLADGLAEGSFSYWGIPKASTNIDQQQGRWMDGWKSRDAMPRLIKITMQSRPGGTTWPQLLVPVHTHVTPGEEQQTMHVPGGAGASDDSFGPDEDAGEPVDDSP